MKENPVNVRRQRICSGIEPLLHLYKREGLCDEGEQLQMRSQRLGTSPEKESKMNWETGSSVRRRRI